MVRKDKNNIKIRQTNAGVVSGKCKYIKINAKSTSIDQQPDSINRFFIGENLKNKVVNKT